MVFQTNSLPIKLYRFLIRSAVGCTTAENLPGAGHDFDQNLLFTSQRNMMFLSFL